MMIYVKIGTMPGQYMHVCRKKKPPKEGDIIEVKPTTARYHKPERIRIDGMKMVGRGSETMFMAERF